MNIVHCCLSCFYIDGYNYQENMLVREHVRAGHDTLVIASTENYDENGILCYGQQGDYIGSDGARVLRVPYRKLGPHFLQRKLRYYEGVYKELSYFKPDVIIFHGACAWELLTVVRYKKNNPLVRLYVDSHEDFHNSGRNFLSKNILHRFFYKSIFNASLPYIDEVLCISIESMEFMGSFYGCSQDKMKYFPLGGNIFNDIDFNNNRAFIRNKLKISDNALVFFQSGKFDSKKKLIESLQAFISLPYEKDIKFIIAGVLQNEIKDKAQKLLNADDRIQFLGWVDSESLLQILCASDVYVQPGSQSATLQNSICCRCAVIVDDVPSHYPFVKGNGWMINNSLSLSESFQCAIQAYNDGTLIAMNKKSLSIAKELLDYKKMAEYLVG